MWRQSLAKLSRKFAGENSKNKVFGIILKISVRIKMFDKSLRKSGKT
jgi:hypothetical protein